MTNISKLQSEAVKELDYLYWDKPFKSPIERLSAVQDLLSDQIEKAYKEGYEEGRADGVKNSSSFVQRL